MHLPGDMGHGGCGRQAVALVGVKQGVMHEQLLWVGVAYKHDGYIPGVLPQLFAVERTGPRSGAIDTVRKVSENAEPA